MSLLSRVLDSWKEKKNTQARTHTDRIYGIAVYEIATNLHARRIITCGKSYVFYRQQNLSILSFA